MEQLRLIHVISMKALFDCQNIACIWRASSVPRCVLLCVCVCHFFTELLSHHTLKVQNGKTNPGSIILVEAVQRGHNDVCVVSRA